MSAGPRQSESAPRGSPLRLPLALAAAFLVLELSASALGPYGWFIDELYYRACSERLDWGYVDHPPLSIGVLAATRQVFGDSLLAQRVWPALAAAAAALAASTLARQLGGGSFARALTVAAVLSSPVVLIFGSFFSMNALELLLWPACTIALLHALARGGRAWLGVGALLGLATLNKHTSAAFGAALMLGSLVSPGRRQWSTRWPWLGLLVAAALVAPNVAWQAAHGWPSLEFYRSAQLLKNIETPALRVVANQLIVTGPGAAPLALLGLAASLRDRVEGRRAPGVAFIVLLAALASSRSSRFERLAAIYPVLIAFGAVSLERLSLGRSGWLRPAACISLAASAAAFLPIAVPLLPPERAARYAAWLGVVPPIERGRTGALPQWLADRLGWPELVADVAAAHRSLSPEDQRRARLFAPSYGEAGALELWGPRLGLPSVLSNHNTYFLWSGDSLRLDAAERPGAADVWLTVGMSRQTLERHFESVTVLGAARCERCVDWRRERPLALARAPRVPTGRLWPALKHFE